MDGPYRAARPLTVVIPPDRRREHAIVFGIACMITGALLCAGLGRFLEARRAPPTPPAGELAFGPSPPDLSVAPAAPVVARFAVPAMAPAPSELGPAVTAHLGSLEQRCVHPWSGTPRVTLSLVVDPAGRVVAASGEGRDTEVADCVATQAMGWHLPPGGAANRHVSVPLSLGSAPDR